jgi:hypothetical protein
MSTGPSSTGVDWFHPGEMVIVARIPNDAATEDRVNATAANMLRTDAASLRSFIFGAPGEDTSLVFLFHKRPDAADAASVKNAVEAMHHQLPSMRAAGVEVLGAMPHWHTRAHEMASGGSPGSFPVPVKPSEMPDRNRRYRIQAIQADLQPNASSAGIPVAIFDTRLDLDRARTRAQKLGNAHLTDTLQNLQPVGGKLNTREWGEVEQHHAAPPADELRYVMSDHAVFVAGLVHELAPNAPLSCAPVLDEYGLGDLSLFLSSLKDLLDGNPNRDPRIVNLSLGFRPHPGHLVAAWHGLDLPGTTPAYRQSNAMAADGQDWRWVTANASLVDQRMDYLQAGLRELGRYLSLNNCLLVAAAGNDSHAGELRLDPRLPARFQSVLGVAATRGDGTPASYSNVGDEQRRGDHVATFGGDRDAGQVPDDGVVSVYAGDFPPTNQDTTPVNETGWAAWSGTSFSTAIISGVAANVWARNPKARASDILAEVHEVARHTSKYIPELRTYAIEVSRGWV